MPRRHRVDKHRRVPSFNEAYFDLVLGPPRRAMNGSLTERDAERAWEVHRERLMEDLCRSTRHFSRVAVRPWAWWAFEAGDDQPHPDDFPQLERETIYSPAGPEDDFVPNYFADAQFSWLAQNRHLFEWEIEETYAAAEREYDSHDRVTGWTARRWAAVLRATA